MGEELRRVCGPHEPELHEGKTKPPRPYTENTLLAAMETSATALLEAARAGDAAATARAHKALKPAYSKFFLKFG